eukprot:jgi/Ulvmu1/3203/UM015_0244.1
MFVRLSQTVRLDCHAEGRDPLQFVAQLSFVIHAAVMTADRLGSGDPTQSEADDVFPLCSMKLLLISHSSYSQGQMLLDQEPHLVEGSARGFDPLLAYSTPVCMLLLCALHTRMRWQEWQSLYWGSGFKEPVAHDQHVRDSVTLTGGLSSARYLHYALHARTVHECDFQVKMYSRST